tara:strand:+ start:96 stop:455 length:360 start_codon:yes stop_codon:yes gene_type:complete
MFCIYGRSRVAASKYIDKKMENYNSDISVKLKLADSQDQKQSIIDSFIDERFKVTPIRKCSHELSAPEFAEELLFLMQKESAFSDLKITKKIQKTLKSGELSFSKTTGKALMKWVDITE